MYNGESIILPTRFAYPGLPHYLTSSLDPLLVKIIPVVKQGIEPVKTIYQPFLRLVHRGQDEYARLRPNRPFTFK